MAHKTVVVFEDDLDGGAAAETVTFGLDGVSYEIDLSGANAALLRDVFAAYVDAGRRVGGRAVVNRRGGAGPTKTDREQFTAVREWARGRGLEVGDRGRIPSHIIEQYHAAANTPEPEPAAAEAPAPRRRARKPV
jgi:nucleoid-associated protein Lsr2